MPFSRQIVSVVAASVLAAHVVVGCCAHHRHLHASVCWAPAELESADHHDHGDCESHSANGPAPCHGEEPGDNSCEGGCSFLAVSRTAVPDLAQLAGLPISTTADSLIHLVNATSGLDSVFEPASPPRVRLHLTKCVLLI